MIIKFQRSSFICEQLLCHFYWIDFQISVLPLPICIIVYSALYFFFLDNIFIWHIRNEVISLYQPSVPIFLKHTVYSVLEGIGMPSSSSVSPEMNELWMRLHLQPSLDGLFFLMVRPLSPRVTMYSDAPAHIYCNVLGPWYLINVCLGDVMVFLIEL